MAQIKRDYPKLAKDIIREVGGKENIVNATPVSYTHLDVYKRQIWFS